MDTGCPASGTFIVSRRGASCTWLDGAKEAPLRCPECGEEGVRCRSVRESWDKVQFVFSDRALDRFADFDAFLDWADREAGEALPLAEALKQAVKQLTIS